MVPGTEQCPVGFVEGVSPIIWPGAVGYGCACHSGSLDAQKHRVKSTFGTCSIGQQQAGCIEDKGIEPVPLRNWRGGVLCVKREGEAAANMGSDFHERPNPVDGTCPEKYQKCGAGSYDTDHAICVPLSVDCPITYIIAQGAIGETPDTAQMNSSSNPFEDSLNNQTMEFISKNGGKNNLYLFTDSAQQLLPGQFPVIEFTYGFEDLRLPEYGPCFGNEFAASVSYMDKVSFKGENHSAQNNYNSACRKFDDRWRLVDEYDEDELLTDTFSAHERCEGLDIGEMMASDYWTTAQACSLDSHYRKSQQCEYRFDLGKVCGDDDDICKKVTKQSTCGHLIHFMAPKIGYKKMGLYARQQLYWASECDKAQVGRFFFFLIFIFFFFFLVLYI
jgi:hypothetical protein